MSETATFPTPAASIEDDADFETNPDLGDEGHDEPHLDENGADEPDDSHEDDDANEGSSGRAKTNNRPLIRRVAVKSQEVIDAPEKTRKVAAHVLGCPDDMPSLVTAIMTADRGTAQVFNDINTVAEADMFEAAVAAGALGRDRMKRVWSMLGLLGLVKSSNLNASNSKAAIEVAKAIHKNDLDEVRGEIESVLNLLKKA